LKGLIRRVYAERQRLEGSLWLVGVPGLGAGDEAREVERAFGLAGAWLGAGWEQVSCAAADLAASLVEAAPPASRLPASALRGLCRGEGLGEEGPLGPLPNAPPPALWCGLLGVRLLASLFAGPRSARAHVLRLCQQGVAGAPDRAPYWVHLLGRLAREQPHRLAGHAPPLRELVEAFAAFPGPVASGALLALLPLADPRAGAVGEGLEDSFVLALRKATFSREEGRRLAALKGVLHLLLERARAPILLPPPAARALTVSVFAGASSSQDPGGSQAPRAPGAGAAATAVDLTGSLRRFLGHQPAVRQALYTGLGAAVAAVGGNLVRLAGELLLPHLARLCAPAADVAAGGCPLLLDVCVSREGRQVRLVEPAACLLACILSVIRAAAVAEEGEGAAAGAQIDRRTPLGALRELFGRTCVALASPRCSQAVLGFQASCNLDAGSAEGRANLLRAEVALGALEVAIEAHLCGAAAVLTRGPADLEAVRELLAKHAGLEDMLANRPKGAALGRSQLEAGAAEAVAAQEKGGSGGGAAAMRKLGRRPVALSLGAAVELLVHVGGALGEGRAPGMAEGGVPPPASQSSSRGSGGGGVGGDESALPESALFARATGERGEGVVGVLTVDDASGGGSLLAEPELKAFVLRACAGLLEGAVHTAPTENAALLAVGACPEAFSDPALRAVEGCPDWAPLAGPVLAACRALFLESGAYRQRDPAEGRGGIPASYEPLAAAAVRCLQSLAHLAGSAGALAAAAEAEGGPERAVLRPLRQMLRACAAAGAPKEAEGLAKVFLKLAGGPPHHLYCGGGGGSGEENTGEAVADGGVDGAFFQGLFQDLEGASASLLRVVLGCALRLERGGAAFAAEIGREVHAVLGDEDGEEEPLGRSDKFPALETSTAGAVALAVLQFCDGALEDLALCVGRLPRVDPARRADLEGAAFRELEGVFRALEAFARVRLPGDAVTDLYLKCLARAYRVTGAAAKAATADRGERQALPHRALVRAVDVMATDLSPGVYDCLLALQGREDAAGARAGQKRPRGGAGGGRRAGKLVPQLVYELEESERRLLALSSACGFNLLRNAKRSVARDFKLDGRRRALMPQAGGGQA